ncbi:MAG TPA: alpha/beta hydrolase [Methylomirabilota bacterium]|jgi:pimeloyl-ACP methyl ester carboxylesterase|nr:alpha/beta hydrolase [Methylomirabilota bacterium]
MAGKKDKDEKPKDAASELRTKHIPFEQLLERLEERRRLSHFGEDRPGLTDARQPEQPKSGPGGADYSHKAVTRSLYGEDELAYWVFEPSQPSPASAPLVLFLHGWGGGSPAKSGAWFDHLAKKGNIVLFPAYQGSMRPWAKPWDRTPPTHMLKNVLTALKDAVQRLQSGGHVRPDLDRFAVTGASLGGALTAQLAAVASKNHLPVPKVIMPMVPGRGLWARQPLPAVDLNTIAASTLMLVVVCEDDRNSGDFEGRAIFSKTSQIPAANKNFIVMLSDRHGTPPLIANHNSPSASNPAYGLGEKDHSPVNARHYYGYWKLFDALMDAAFHQRNREYALGDTPPQRFMGVWSDGVPVKPLQVVTDAKLLPPFRFQSRLFARRAGP